MVSALQPFQSPTNPSHSSFSPHSLTQTSTSQPSQPSPARPHPSSDPDTRFDLVQGSELNNISVVSVSDSSLRPRRRGSRPRPSLQDEKGGSEHNLSYRGDGGMYRGDLNMYRSNEDMYSGDREEKQEGNHSQVSREIPG